MLAFHSITTSTASTEEAANLTALTDRIRDEHKAAQTAMCHAVAHALNAGDALIQAKAAVPAGTWRRWMEWNTLVDELRLLGTDRALEATIEAERTAT